MQTGTCFDMSIGERYALYHGDSVLALPGIPERLYELARQDRQRSTTLYAHGNRWHSVTDPIDAEIYRIRCELYCALAQGAEPENAFESHYAQAKTAVEKFNARQAELFKPGWRTGITGYMGVDEAWQRLRHAIRIHKSLVDMATSTDAPLPLPEEIPQFQS
jgi:hypothetical protein